MKRQLTNKLKPVTVAKEVAIEAPDRANSPRWPTNITDIICKLNSNRFTDIRGPASHTCFLTSSITFFLLIPLSLLLPSLVLNSFSSEMWIKGDPKDAFLSSSSLSIFFFAPHTHREGREYWKAGRGWPYFLVCFILRLELFLWGLKCPWRSMGVRVI